MAQHAVGMDLIHIITRTNKSNKTTQKNLKPKHNRTATKPHKPGPHPEISGDFLDTVKVKACKWSCGKSGLEHQSVSICGRNTPRPIRRALKQTLFFMFLCPLKAKPGGKRNVTPQLPQPVLGPVLYLMLWKVRKAQSC